MSTIVTVMRLAAEAGPLKGMWHALLAACPVYASIPVELIMANDETAVIVALWDPVDQIGTVVAIEIRENPPRAVLVMLPDNTEKWGRDTSPLMEQLPPNTIAPSRLGACQSWKLRPS